MGDLAFLVSSAANALLHKCNGLWKSALNKLAAIDDEDKSSGSNGSAAVDNAAAPSDGGGDDDVLDVSRSPVFDLRFFKNAARSANDLAGGSSMTGWTEESVAAGAERALEFFRKAQVRTALPFCRWCCVWLLVLV